MSIILEIRKGVTLRLWEKNEQIYIMTPNYWSNKQTFWGKLFQYRNMENICRILKETIEYKLIWICQGN